LNPLGFLGPEHDENRYLQRALNLLEVMDGNQDKSLCHVNLDSTFGKLATAIDTFTLPRNLVNKQLEIRLYIVTQGLSEQTLFVKNFFVF